MSLPHTCYIGLGSNLNNPSQQLNTAINHLNQNSHIKIVLISSFKETKPVGYLKQNNFINAAIKLTTSLSPFKLLDILQEIELTQGRNRGAGPRFGPRTLDLDILLYDDLAIEYANLTIPHPRMHQREFVIQPLKELAKIANSYGDDCAYLEAWLQTLTS